MTRSVAESLDLNAVLLDVSDINSIMNSTDLEKVDEGDAPDDTVDASPPDCHGVIYLVGEIEYGPTDFTAMRWQVVAAANVGTVVQAATQFPSASKADQFIEEQATAWEACAGEVIRAEEKGGGSPTTYRVDSVRAHPHVVIASTRVTDSDLRCQHVLQAVSNVVLDVSACGADVLEEAEAIASEIATKIQSG